MLAALCFLVGFFGSAQIVCFALVRENHPAALSGTAIGFVNGMVTGAGALFQPLVGLLLDLAWTGGDRARAPASTTPESLPPGVRLADRVLPRRPPLPPSRARDPLPSAGVSRLDDGQAKRRRARPDGAFPPVGAFRLGFLDLCGLLAATFPVVLQNRR